MPSKKQPEKVRLQQPSQRRLRGFAFDPSQSLNIDTVKINEITYSIPWESTLQPGPEGEYVKVIDRDPASNAVYLPVDLNRPELLASDGLPPGENNPQFHQQMVYAVAMNTISNFEKAIGRKVQWSSVRKEVKYKQRGRAKTANRLFYVDKLLIYPHALREANAYYSPDRKALLFGYFNSTPAQEDLQMPGSIVFTCLSHDIIAHETTHAILDGMFSRYMEQTHPDVSAFHEAFADIVALFQHFTFPEVLKHQIAKMRGSFDSENLLGKLAVEFGLASGSYGALRDAIGKIDKKGEWKRAKPDPNQYRETFEPHDRGSILVAAVFDAFINIYNDRTSDLIRIASGGTGILPEGDLNTDLVNRLAAEAAKTASHVLNMCIRALDYCPPVDINYGDYLRAVITADTELVSNDNRNYRISFIDSFRKRGIYPEGVSNLSIETLIYTPEEQPEEFESFADLLTEFLREFKNEMTYVTDRRKIFNKTNGFISGKKFTAEDMDNKNVTGLHEYFFTHATGANALLFEKLTGLVFSRNYTKLNIKESPSYTGYPSIEIHALRLSNRVGPGGTLQNQAIISLGQRCGVKMVHDDINDDYSISTFRLNDKREFDEDGCFIFRGGCTLIFDLDTMKLTNVISKPILDMSGLKTGKPGEYRVNENRARIQFRCMFGDYSEMTGFARIKENVEPFAGIHRHD